MPNTIFIWKKIKSLALVIICNKLNEKVAVIELFHDVHTGGSNMKHRFARLILLLMIMMLVAGCAKGVAHLEVKRDGSTELTFSMKLDARLKLLAGDNLENTIREKLEGTGYQLEVLQQDDEMEWLVNRSFDSIEQMREELGFQNDYMNLVTVNEEESFFFTKYDIKTEASAGADLAWLQQYITDLNLSEPISRMIIQNFGMDLKLTLPIKLFVEHNASSEEGRTLTWHTSLTDFESIELSFYAPNLVNILLVAGVVVILLLVIIVAFLKRKRKKAMVKTKNME